MEGNFSVIILVPCQLGECRKGPKGCMCEVPSLQRVNLQGIFSPLKAHVDLDVVSTETTAIIKVLAAAQKRARCGRSLGRQECFSGGVEPGKDLVCR